MLLTNWLTTIAERYQATRRTGHCGRRLARRHRRSAIGHRVVAAQSVETLEDRVLLSIGSLPESIVKHTPYLQLGNAPLVGFDGGTDQIEVLWQTIPGGGSGTDDAFTVEYRAAGAPTWIDAGAISTIDTGVESRINHFVAITGLQYDTDYEYRVIHERGGQEVTT